MRMRKILLALTLLLVLVGTAYAGCWTTYNFSPTTLQVSNKSRLLLQCFAMRTGGTGWTIAADGMSVTHAGETYSASAPNCGGGSCDLFVVKNGGNGTHFMNATTDPNGAAVMTVWYTPANENGRCELYTSNNVNPGWNNLAGLSVRVRYCR